MFQGGDSATLLCSAGSLLGAMCPDLKPSAQESHGPVGMSPEEGHKDDQKDGTPLL